MSEATFDIRQLAEDVRQVAVGGTVAAMAAVKEYLIGGVPQVDGSQRPALSYNAEHAGDVPEPIDAVATVVGEDYVRSELMRRGVSGRSILSAGEEAGNGTQLVQRDLYLMRWDALDGSGSALARFDGHASVCSIDRSRADGSARNLAGAIACSSGWTVSWAQWSARDPEKRYRRLAGAVYLSNPAWDIVETELTAIRWDRRHATLAAVAHTDLRREGVLEIADRLGVPYDRAMWTSGGTPLAPGLVAGQIGAVIEPSPVSLHDSVLLVPYQLLGGSIFTPAGLPLDYLHEYEAHALDLHPGAKPIQGYVAWAK